MIHRLTKVRFPDGAPAGTLRRALDEDRPLIRRWAQGFVEDAATTEAPDSFADRVVAAGQMFVWDDGDPRCMVAAARSTPNGTCINAVYTPPRFRRRGYATVAVATLSRQLLDAGSAFCCLYTDLANPTSNSIYRRIGYEPIREGVDISFEVTDAVD